MATIVANGCTIHYQERGSGLPVVLTTGGRWGGYVQEDIANAMAAHHRVITWDRRNCDGASDIIIEGEASEAEIWAEDLAELIRQLDLAPCYVGEYAGCRTTPWLCIRHPELFKGMLLAWPSGGEVPAQRLPINFYMQYIDAAQKGGMAAVADIGFFADSIKLNPSNRDRTLAMDPQKFIGVMRRWADVFLQSADRPTAGCTASDAEWASIQAPSIIVAGCDPVHSIEAGERVHRVVPTSELHEPVLTVEEWEAVFGKYPYAVTSKLQGERVAPVWLDFIRRHEA